MKRFISLILGCILLAAFAIAAPSQIILRKSDAVEDGLIGPVRRIELFREATSSNNKSVVIGRREPILAQEHDADGSLLKVDTFKDGLLLQTTRFFTTEGLRVRAIDNFEIVENKELRRLVTPPNRPCGQEKSYDLVTVYAYDARGNRIVEEILDACGDTKSIAVISYDSKGLKTRRREKIFLYSNPIERTVEFKHDKSGNLIEISREHHYRDRYSDYEFDATGNWIKRRIRSTRFGLESLRDTKDRITEYTEIRKIEYFPIKDVY